MLPTRSLLLVPGSRPAALDDPIADIADAILLDLAATVPDPHKDEARVVVHGLIASADRRWWVRINPISAGFLAEDLAAALGAGHIEGIVLPDVSRTDQLSAVDAAITGAEARFGLESGKTGLIVELDTARAVFFAHALATASPRIASVAVDSSQHGGVATDLGCAWSIDGPEIIYARQYALIAARAAGLSCPLDGYFADVEDSDGLRRDTAVSRRLGYRGRVVVGPRQIEIANRIYSPTLEEVAYHQRVLDTLEQAVADGRAAVTLDGKMIDYAHAATARAVIAQAREFGIVP